MGLVRVDSIATKDAWWASRKPEMDFYNAFLKHFCPAYDEDLNHKREFFSTKEVPVSVELSGFITYTYSLGWVYDCMESNDVLFYRNQAIPYAILDYIRKVYGNDYKIVIQLEIYDNVTSLRFLVGNDSKACIVLRSIIDSDTAALEHDLYVGMPYISNTAHDSIPDSAGVKEILDIVRARLIDGFIAARDRNSLTVVKAQERVKQADDRIARA